MGRIRDAWKELSTGTKRLLIILVVGAVAFAAVGAVLLNRSNSKVEYTTLFTGLSQDEAQEIAQVITDQNIQYLYDATTGTIQVPKEQEDQLRADLLSQGYPKSGFTYDTYISNSGLMATESDKKQYTLYELQDRLGATIRLFDGVQDAKVTIAKGDEDSYVLNEDGSTNDGSNTDVSASVVVTMQQGETLTEKNADAIRNLVARSVNGLNFTSVSVFDAATMTEVGGSGTDTDTATSQEVNDLTNDVEASIAQKVKNVLGKIYNADNVEVSVKGKLDMSSVISEDTQYSVPVQSTSDDKVGLLSNEDDETAYTGPNAKNAAGVAGTDSNADTPEYVVSDSTDGDGTESFDTSTSREWLYNTLKTQTEKNPGTLTDVSIAVVIDTDDTSITEAELTDLIADAAGINRNDASNKITIVREPITATSSSSTSETTTPETQPDDSLMRLLIMIGAAAVALIVVLIILLTRRRKKKAAAEAAAAEAAEEQAELERQEAEAAAAAAEEAAKKAEEERPERQTSLEEIAANERVQRSEELKENIGNFIDENPQAAAKLIQSWLREGEDKNGRKQYTRK
ncbi:MAG: flagellar basal-body MS-ring/collar protein FliF [Eubacteriales bacterium]